MASAAVPVAPELNVDLCGRAARVPLRPEEGLGDLRTRVAGAFGLTAPFDLLGPGGTPMRSDHDAARVAASAAAATAGAAGAGPRGPGKEAQDAAFATGSGTEPSPTPHVTVAANEEALLDLERAHEESGALRWALLRQLITGLRTQITEVNVAVSESKHRTAVLDEELLRERSGREAGDAALRGDLQELAEGLRAELRREKQEARAAVAAATAARASCFSRRSSARKPSASSWRSPRSAASPASRPDLSLNSSSSSTAVRCLDSLTATFTSVICVRSPVMSCRSSAHRSAPDSS
mmetsp:Transcript_65144/g.210015  ORF Transcript_65144/g.210015 Transcript_65144/m.210015 type:complete len:295 (-) Transcript_65144:439-1323(-)